MAASTPLSQAFRSPDELALGCCAIRWSWPSLNEVDAGGNQVHHPEKYAAGLRRQAGRPHLQNLGFESVRQGDGPVEHRLPAHCADNALMHGDGAVLGQRPDPQVAFGFAHGFHHRSRSEARENVRAGCRDTVSDRPAGAGMGHGINGLREMRSGLCAHLGAPSA